MAGRDAMVAALRSLQTLKQGEDPKQHQAIAAFKITRPAKKGFRALFSTHPPLEERISRLEQFEYA